jgi:phage-related protein
MPRTLPAGTENWLAKQGGSFVPVVLVDIQTIDGTQYFWTDYEGTYPAKIAAGNQFYSGWIKSGCNFTCSRDLTSNAGDLLLQNLSGNTIDRDVASALKNHEFEGAFAVTRLWVPLLDVSIQEFHCYLSEQNPKEDEAGFRELQLFDPAQFFLAADIQVSECTWRFKGTQCGSTGSATTCPKTLAACQSATRLAQERFNGILTTISNTVNVPPLSGGGSGINGSISSEPGGSGVRTPSDRGPLRS